MEKASCAGQTIVHMLENLKTTFSMDKDIIDGKMEENIKDRM